MTQNIDKDLQRFKQIVRGKVRGNLRKYITHGEMLGRKGREVVSIPVPNIEIPHFRH
ncbi:MAG: stress response protein, partial [Rubinisphaera sp.]